jgi:hypothetical protein
VTPLAWTLYILAGVAAVLAWVVAWQRRSYRPVAWLLTFQAVSDVFRRMLREFVFMPRYAQLGEAPATGWLRVVAHVDQVLFLGWRVGIAALGIWIFGKRKPWLVAAVFVVVAIVLVAGYPTVRGEVLQKAYLGVELAVLCVSLGFFIRWYLGREPWTLEHIVTGVIIALEAAMVTGGPFRGIIWVNWDKAWSILLVLYITVIGIEGSAWSRSKDSQQP